MIEMTHRNRHPQNIQRLLVDIFIKTNSHVGYRIVQQQQQQQMAIVCRRRRAQNPVHHPHYKNTIMN
jgi:hypothetical protein